METRAFDVVIIGGGPAGLGAALYTQRAGLKTLVIEKMIAGGQVNIIKSLENYLGLPEIAGSDLADQMYAQVQKLGTEFLFDEIEKLDLSNKTVYTPEMIATGKVLILALGAEPRKTGADNETRFLNNGVHYCATCDGPLYRGKDVIVVGGTVTALEDALYLASVCHHVTIINPEPKFSVSKALLNALNEQTNVSVQHHCKVSALGGVNKLEHVTITDLRTQQQMELQAAGVFVAIGRVPNLELCQGQLKLDENGYVLTDENCLTNLAGVYAVGDMRAKNCRQVITAVADGAIAATAALTDIKTKGVGK